jgi:hypothetical protein
VARAPARRRQRAPEAAEGDVHAHQLAQQLLVSRQLVRHREDRLIGRHEEGERRFGALDEANEVGIRHVEALACCCAYIEVSEDGRTDAANLEAVAKEKYPAHLATVHADIKPFEERCCYRPAAKGGTYRYTLEQSQKRRAHAAVNLMTDTFKAARKCCVNVINVEYIGMLNKDGTAPVGRGARRAHQESARQAGCHDRAGRC